MTITSDDRDQYESTVEDFIPQPRPDMCIPVALKNVLDELSERHGVDGLSMSIQELSDIFDYRDQFASATNDIPARIDPVLRDYGYDSRVVSGITLDDLQAIIDHENRSYPIVDVHETYFENVVDYDPRPGGDGFQWPHVIVPFKVNHESILFYDPYEEIFQRSTRVDSPPTEMSQRQFYELWSAPDTRWTMWIQREGQRTLTSPEFAEDNNGSD